MDAYLLSDDGLIKRLSFFSPNSDTANAIIEEGVLYIGVVVKVDLISINQKTKI